MSTNKNNSILNTKKASIKIPSKLREEYKVEIRKKAEEYSSKRYAERVIDVYRGVLTGGIKDNITKKEGIKDGKEKIIKECI